MVTCFRQFFFIFIGTVLRCPLWLIIGVAGRFRFFQFVFLVYPTSEVECREFCPNVPILRRYLSGRPTPGGLVVDGWRPIGIYFVVPDLPRFLARKKNRKVAENIVKRMCWIRRLTGAKTIGLAGQLGPIFEKRHNIPIESPIFSSINGSIFSIHEAIKYAAIQEKSFSQKLNIIIAGGGELGETLQQFLIGEGFSSCDIVDVRFNRKGNALPVTTIADQGVLQRANLCVNLLPKGENFIESNLPNLICSKASIVDFSRPSIDSSLLKQKVYMGNRVQRTGMKFVLALPGGWSQHQLPACSLPALIAALTGEINNKLDTFCLHARKQAFLTALTQNEDQVPWSSVSGNLVTQNKQLSVS